MQSISIKSREAYLIMQKPLHDTHSGLDSLLKKIGVILELPF